jgi:arylsulfatase A-like enzyme
VNTPLRGFKTTTLEGGMRVPTIAWWPGKIPAGASTDGITSMMDILPTFAAIVGGKLPERKIDGADVSAVLMGKTGAKSPHADAFYYYRGLALEAVRSGDWKLQFTDGGKKGQGAAAAARQAKKGAAGDEGFPRLYNLADDIGESNNVAAEHADVVSKLKALADQMKDDLGLDGIGPGCREMGRVAKPQPLISRDGKIREGFAP